MRFKSMQKETKFDKIWVNDQMKNSNLDYNAKHWILSTAKHPVVQFQESAHRDNLHEGTEDVRNNRQQEFSVVWWRISLRNTMSRCIKCRHKKANPIHPSTADLAAVIRFNASYGNPSTIIRDNGTSFVGAANELKAFMDEWDKAKIESDWEQKNNVWKFKPPGAPRFGGVWERFVQSGNKIMMEILDILSLRGEVLRTTMCLMEQIVNARPLTAVSEKDLTPSKTDDSLLGQENASTTFMPPSYYYYHGLKKWSIMAQAYADKIWKSWTRGYLPKEIRDWSGQKKMCEYWKKENLFGWQLIQWEDVITKRIGLYKCSKATIAA